MSGQIIDAIPAGSQRERVKVSHPKAIAFMENFPRIDLRELVDAVNIIDEGHASNSITVEKLVRFVKDNEEEFSDTARSFLTEWLKENERLRPGDRKLQTSIIEAKVLLNSYQKTLDAVPDEAAKALNEFFVQTTRELNAQYADVKKDFEAKRDAVDKAIADGVTKRLYAMSRIRRLLYKTPVLYSRLPELKFRVNCKNYIGFPLLFIGGGLFASQVYQFYSTEFWPSYSWLEMLRYIATPRGEFLNRWIEYPQSWNRLHSLLGAISAPMTFLVLAAPLIWSGMAAQKDIRRGHYYVPK